jgi:phosphatidylglycerol:prolipoprotein diacylglycerol transferase
MHPSLGELWGHSIPAYFSFVVLGFAVATWLAARWATRSGLDKEVLIDLGLFSLITGILGGRLMHVVADGYFMDYVNLCIDHAAVDWRITPAMCAHYEGVWDAAKNVCHPAEADCFQWAKFWSGGLTYYGGLLSASIFGILFLRRERFPVLKACDAAGMVLPVGLFLGRLGCFLGGCCFGTQTDSWLAVRFPPGSSASESQWREGLLRTPELQSLAVHPTQLYEAFGCLALAALLMFGLHPRKRFDGEVFLGFVAGYAVLRFALEMLRADDRGGWLGLSTSQLIGLAALAVCAVTWRYLRARSRAALG